MRSGLLVKLLGTFVLVILIGAGLTYWMTSRATQDAFSVYSTRSSQVWAQKLAPMLAEYYQRTGSWTGVETVLQTETPGSGAGSSGQRGLGNASNAGQGLGFGRQVMGGGLAGGTGQHIILADRSGVVVFNSLNGITGDRLSPQDEENGVAVLNADNQQVGTLVISPNDFASSGTLSTDFLNSVNQSILISAAISGLLALILGAILFIQITAPIRQLKTAAHSIAKGDLTQRVTVRSSDELGDLGRSFNDMADNLVRAETQRHNLIADVAHELRTPLSVMRANLEGIRDEVLPLEMQRIDAIYMEALLLNRLVDDLRLLSLAEAGELKLEFNRVDSEQLIHQVLERLKPQAAQKSIRFETDIRQGLPPIWGDLDRLVQVFNNLLVNALRYTPENGLISVKAGLSPLNNRQIVFEISDNGPGIDPSKLPYVFDRFYRADQSRNRASGGSGLGLAIVKQLVEAHGGVVTVDSPVYQDRDNKGYGTRFLIKIPLAGIEN